MEINTRRHFFGKIAAMAALVTGAPKLFAQQAPAWSAHAWKRARGRTRRRYASSPGRR